MRKAEEIGQQDQEAHDLCHGLRQEHRRHLLGQPEEHAGQQRAHGIAEPAQHHDDEGDDGVFGAGERVKGREHQGDQHAGDAGQRRCQREGEGVTMSTPRI